jgi:NAD(P)-dependent dehydrogenase (short-subunit alcohol dehydrogenase family)
MSGTVLVTGVSGGVGPAIAGRLIADGWRVVGVVRSGAAPDGVEAVRADITDPDQVAAAVSMATADGQAPLRAVVNAAGGFAAGGRVHEVPVEDFEAQLRLNLRSAYVVTAACLPHLLAAHGGSVVCFGSRAAVRPFAGAAGYITAKAALLALVSTLAVEYKDAGIRVNAILPSVIDTPGNRADNPGADYSRWVSPAQVADVVAYLCSDASAAVSGAHMPVYGRA